jgi:hypothetical protein
LVQQSTGEPLTVFRQLQMFPWWCPGVSSEWQTNGTQLNALCKHRLWTGIGDSYCDCFISHTVHLLIIEV